MRVAEATADSECTVAAEYDLGERFDLKAKYADKGWVDEDAEFGKQACDLRHIDVHMAVFLLNVLRLCDAWLRCAPVGIQLLKMSCACDPHQVARFFSGFGGKKKPADKDEEKGSGKAKKKALMTDYPLLRNASFV